MRSTGLSQKHLNGITVTKRDSREQFDIITDYVDIANKKAHLIILKNESRDYITLDPSHQSVEYNGLELDIRKDSDKSILLTARYDEKNIKLGKTHIYPKRILE